MLLEFEQEILKLSNESSALTIIAKGLSIHSIIKSLFNCYNNKQSLLVVLNMTSKQAKYFSDYCVLENITKFTVPQRIKKYKTGGIYYGSSRAFITDFINQNVNIEMISAIVVMNAETIKPDSTESFILYLFKKSNTLGLIKAFSSQPLEVNRHSLATTARSLNLNRILFYPRFHEKITGCFKEIVIAQVHIKQRSTLMLEIAILIEEIMKKIYLSIKRQNAGQDNIFDFMDILIYKQKNKDLKNFKKLISLIFSCDSLTVYLYYKLMIERQKINKIESSWIFSEQSHLLLDALKSSLDADISKSQSITQNFILDIEESVFRINLQSIINNSQSSENAISTSKPEESKRKEDEGSSSFSDSAEECSGHDPFEDDSVGLILENKNLSKFYLSNLKIKKLAEIIDEARKCDKETDKYARSAVIVQNRSIKKSIKHALASLDMLRYTRVLTHAEIQVESLNFTTIILLSPHLGTIRYIEYLGTINTVPKVFIIQYVDSIEEQQFITEIRKEKDSFEEMIEDRNNLPLRMELEMLDLEEDSDEHEYEITVDSREMRAKLPFYLYKAGNKIEVKVMELGDYLVGKNKCIERKSIEDFIGSVNSGRLYQQAQKLVYHYKTPILLLEFEECIPTLISFEYAEEFRNSLIAKLCLFLYNFHNFVIIWSNSPVNTVKLIRNIQKQEMNSNAVENSIDPMLMEILLCVPGINSFNVSRILQEFNNLKDLAFSTKERLERVLDSITAAKIYTFFRQKFSEFSKNF